MRKPSAKQPKVNGGKASPHHKKPAQPKKPTKPAKAKKPQHAATHKKPQKAKPVHPNHHKLSLFGRRSTTVMPRTDAAFVDLAADPAMPPISDQGEGSCIAHASLAMFMWGTAKGLDITRITSVDTEGVQACLSSGVPVVSGLTVLEGFTTTQAITSGVVPLPSRRERVVDGHYLLIVGIGYGHEWAGQFPAAEPHTHYVKMRNSWGPEVYRQGYLLLPIDYLHAYATELWTIG